MNADSIRCSFLEFFMTKNHRVVPSDSLVPKNDPTLLFTSAGMNQFKDEFLGKVTDFRRATSCQKCLRTADLERVGKTSYHHTFFEMLGNFSFGDYFKEEAIFFAWEYLTKILKISPELLWVSVYQEDEESFKIWNTKIGIPEKKIVRLGAGDNFWPANALEDGPDGPCGPCSEIYFDRGSHLGCKNTTCSPACNCGRFVEVWNLVFTQFNRIGFQKVEPLPSKNIDTGMGLERLCSVLQRKETNFEIDIFVPLIEEVRRQSGLHEQPALAAVADHARAITFAIGDGIYPSNEDRGYVIRRIIRRALWFGFSAGKQSPFLYSLVPTVGMLMRSAYPELYDKKEAIAQIVKAEEEKFLATLETGRTVLDGYIEHARINQKSIDACSAFKMYDTFGFPLELTCLIAENEHVAVDRDGFEVLMKQQRELSRKSSKFKDAVFVSHNFACEHSTEFIGHEQVSAVAKVIGIVENGVAVNTLKENGAAILVLDRTPFYGTSGGQLHDTGVIEDKDHTVCFEVSEVSKNGMTILHHGILKRGTLQVESAVVATVNTERRNALERAHTATHLLQAALRAVLGGHIEQQGSFVDEDQFRFDFNHYQKLSGHEIQEVENFVADMILSARPLKKYFLSLEEARKQNALAFFEEKYGQTVRVVEVEGVSKELCGGTHLSNTAQVGIFKIISDSSVSSGIRRIEAVTGKRALLEIIKKQDLLLELSDIAKTNVTNLPEVFRETIAKVKKQEKELSLLREELFRSKIPGILEQKHSIHGNTVILFSEKNVDQNFLGKAVDSVKKQWTHPGLVIGVALAESSFTAVISRTKDGSGFSCGKLAQYLSGKFSGSGGGRDDFAFAGGKIQPKDRNNFEEKILEIFTEFFSA